MYRLATDNNYYYDGLVKSACREQAPEIHNRLNKILISITSNKIKRWRCLVMVNTQMTPVWRCLVKICIAQVWKLAFPIKAQKSSVGIAVYRLFYTTSVLLFGSKSSIRPVRSSACSGLVGLIAIGGRSLILISFLNKSAMFFCKVIEQQAQKGFHKIVYNAATML